MANLNELRLRVNALLRQPVRRIPQPGLLAAEEALPPQFSPFRVEDARRASTLAGRFRAVAASAPGDEGLEFAVNLFEQTLQREDTGLAKHAFMIFLTHDPKGREIPIPKLEQREPRAVLPSIPPEQLAGAPALLGATGQEALLNWFREDPLANEHHEHWHLVYPMGGVDDGQGGVKTKDREGELFFYMHQQMLARYDAERLAVGLEPVKPFPVYTEPIAEGYDPGPLELENSTLSARPDDTRLVDIRGYTVAQHGDLRDQMLQAVNTLKFNSGVDVTIDVLGATEEPTVGSVDGDFYGNHHGMGHVLVASVMDPHGRQGLPPGVMIVPKTAIRDPFFFRWHKHVDDIAFALQEKSPPYAFDDAPKVTLRKAGSAAGKGSPDIILAFADNVPGGDFQKFGDSNFGGANWDGEFYDKTPATGLLETSMEFRTVPASDTSTANLTYVDHREFVYFIRVTSPSLIDTPVTVRIFLVPEGAYADDRRKWIEMDKFKQTLKAGKNLIVRPGSLSSVVRKPAVKPGQPVPDCPGEDPDYCECGWPYTMLLPRGNEDGMTFLLLVLLTDWNKDRVGNDSCCGSMSFCGVQDQYPDKREMGYPFNRPFAKPILEVLQSIPSAAMRPIQVKLKKS